MRYSPVSHLYNETVFSLHRRPNESHCALFKWQLSGGTAGGNLPVSDCMLSTSWWCKKLATFLSQIGASRVFLCWCQPTPSATDGVLLSDPTQGNPPRVQPHRGTAHGFRFAREIGETVSAKEQADGITRSKRFLGNPCVILSLGHIQRGRKSWSHDLLSYQLGRFSLFGDRFNFPIFYALPKNLNSYQNWSLQSMFLHSKFGCKYFPFPSKWC